MSEPRDRWTCRESPARLRRSERFRDAISLGIDSCLKGGPQSSLVLRSVIAQVGLKEFPAQFRGWPLLTEGAESESAVQRVGEVEGVPGRAGGWFAHARSLTSRAGSTAFLELNLTYAGLERRVARFAVSGRSVGRPGRARGAAIFRSG